MLESSHLILVPSTVVAAGVSALVAMMTLSPVFLDAWKRRVAQLALWRVRRGSLTDAGGRGYGGPTYGGCDPHDRRPGAAERYLRFALSSPRTTTTKSATAGWPGAGFERRALDRSDVPRPPLSCQSICGADVPAFAAAGLGTGPFSSFASTVIHCGASTACVWSKAPMSTVPCRPKNVATLVFAVSASSTSAVAAPSVTTVSPRSTPLSLSFAPLKNQSDEPPPVTLSTLPSSWTVAALSWGEISV